jgi:hypothetical protein
MHNSICETRNCKDKDIRRTKVKVFLSKASIYNLQLQTQMYCKSRLRNVIEGMIEDLRKPR